MTIEKAIEHAKQIARNETECELGCLFKNDNLVGLLYELMFLREEKKLKKENKPLTMRELIEMDGVPVWIDNGDVADPWRWKCYIVNNNYEVNGRIHPCGVDLWGHGTSLSLLQQCGLYLFPEK